MPAYRSPFRSTTRHTIEPVRDESPDESVADITSDLNADFSQARREEDVSGPDRSRARRRIERESHDGRPEAPHAVWWRRFLAHWRAALLLISLGSLVWASGCEKLNLRGQTPDDDDDDVAKKPKTTLIGDQVAITGLHPIQIEGVGLVTNLDNTGGDLPPSLFRTMLTDDMRKRGVSDPNTVLRSPRNALVLIRATLPPVIAKGETFDIEVVIPERSDATSLSGGWLMESYLAEQAIVPGQGPKKGENLAKCKGPVLVSMNEDGKTKPGDMLRGRVLGGGVYTGGIRHQERVLGLYLKNEFRSVRNAKRVADAIGKRFFDYDGGLKRSLAKATTDQHVELKVHKRYKQNYMRFVQVCRSIALHETGVEQHARIERLRKQLGEPKLASESALQLEAIGNETVPVLKEALNNASFEVRFYAADALAYLGDSSGTHVLLEAAKKEDAFRVFSLAALATLDNTETSEGLFELMSDPNAETRYGAFHALHTIDKKHPAVRGETIANQYHLHLVPCDGEAMVHVTKFRKPQIVLFGASQALRAPLALTGGPHIVINAPAGSETVTVSRFHPNDPDRQRIVSPRLADVIRAMGELGATYPDVVQMLNQANKQGNTEGPLVVDAMPQAGRIYYRGNSDTKDAPKIGEARALPNLFENTRSSGRSGSGSSSGDVDSASDTSASTTGSRSSPSATNDRPSSNTPGEASAADASDTTNKSSAKPSATAPKKSGSSWFRNPFGPGGSLETAPSGQSEPGS